MNYKLKKISGDASYREFYRLKKGDKTSIIVLAKKEKFKNLITYIIINDILKKNNIQAPKLLSSDYKNGIIEITDLGKKTFFETILLKKDKLKDYKNLIKLIVKVQKIKLKKVYRFQKYKINIQKYTIKNLHKESDLFFDWYLKYCSKNLKLAKVKKIIKKELNKIYKKLYFNNNTFVHRDFHASNIIINKNIFGLIDSQDAISGNPMYDVASLIDDVRIKLSNNLQNKLLQYYYKISQFKNNKLENLKNDYDILSIQRNLKILGIFVRLYKRDNKPNYIKYLPYTWTLIERRLKNPIFKNLNLLFEKHLKVKKLKKIKYL